MPRFQRAVRWLLLLALTVPLAVGVSGVGDRDAGATSGSPAAVAVHFALKQLGKSYRWGADGPRSYDFATPPWSPPCAAPTRPWSRSGSRPATGLVLLAELLAAAPPGWPSRSPPSCARSAGAGAAVAATDDAGLAALVRCAGPSGQGAYFAGPMSRHA
jgi:hypothetical protein